MTQQRKQPYGRKRLEQEKKGVASFVSNDVRCVFAFRQHDSSRRHENKQWYSKLCRVRTRPRPCSLGVITEGLLGGGSGQARGPQQKKKRYFKQFIPLYFVIGGIKTQRGVFLPHMCRQKAKLSVRHTVRRLKSPFKNGERAVWGSCTCTITSFWGRRTHPCQRFRFPHSSHSHRPQRKPTTSAPHPARVHPPVSPTHC